MLWFFSYVQLIVRFVLNPKALFLKYLGVSLGLNYFVASPIFGVNFEMAIDDNWGVGGLVRYWTWGEDLVTYSFDYTYIFIGAQGNYHFKFMGPTADFYAGVTLGYGVFSFSSSDSFYDNQAVGSSKLLFGIHAGIRYDLSKSVLLTGRISVGGTDFGGIEAGVDFRI